MGRDTLFTAVVASLLLAGYFTEVSGFLFSSDDNDGKLAKFEVYTRKNSDYMAGTGTGQYIKIDDRKSVEDSFFNASKPTKIFIHGWFGAGWNWYIRDMRRELIEKEDVNFIQVDWSWGGSINLNYFNAKTKAQQAGAEVAELVHFLHKEFGLAYKLVHIIGHSLGGQAAGSAGRNVQNPRVGRISGLDPAQPGFFLDKPSDTLDPTDADFVDVIHTTRVSVEPMGHVDFYPNGGVLGIPVLSWINSHLEAVYIFTESVNNQCVLNGRQCASYSQLKFNQCSDACTNSTCNLMGYYASPTKAMGKLYLTIKERAPYC